MYWLINHTALSPFPEFTELVELPQDEDECEGGADDSKYSDCVVPFFYGVKHDRKSETLEYW